MKKLKITTRLNDYYPDRSMKTIFLNTENSKTDEPHKFVVNLPQRLELRHSNKLAALQNFTRGKI